MLLAREDARACTAFVALGALCFGACHAQQGTARANLAAFIMTFVFGIYAAVIMCKTRSVWCCVLLHAHCNWLGPPRPLPPARDPRDLLALKTAFFAGVPLFLALLVLL